MANKKNSETTTPPEQPAVAETPVVTAKSKALKTLRNTTITIVVLLALVIGAGLAYTWYMGQHTEPYSNVVEQETTAAPYSTPTRPASNVPVGVSVQSITSPVAPGSNASITIKTKPDAVCVITAVYNQIASKDSGLLKKTADEFGMITWAWTVESSAPVGKWPVTVTCEENKRTAVVIGDLVIAAAKTE